MIPVYTFGLQVTLIRLVDRTDGKADASFHKFKTVDLTPFLGTDGQVKVVKDIGQPAGGWSITFGDKIHPEFLDTVYALVEPMDLIEIRAARTPSDFSGTKLPLLMRGFVSTVGRPESMSNDGTPQRSVIIAGQDMGKLFQVNHIYFELSVLTEKPYLLTFHLQTATGIDVGPLPVNDYMHQVVEKVINPKVLEMGVFADTQIKPFIVDAAVPDGVVLPFLVQNVDLVPVWQLIEMFADRPWNEAFVRDAEDGPHFVFRPAPYKDLETGKYIMNGATDPGSVAITDLDIVTTSMERSDHRVANFFWVPPSFNTLLSNGSLEAFSLMDGWPLDFKYDNNAPEIFGVRKMTAQTNLIEGDTKPVNMLPTDRQGEALSGLQQWFFKRSRDLMAMNRDNSVFEEGGMVLKGDEKLAIGKYLRLTRGSLTSESYITQIAHQITPLTLWTTSVRLIRGTNFYVRNKIRNQSPYWMEGRRGPNSP